MEGAERIVKISVLWRGEKLTVEMNSGATLQDFGNELQKMTHVKADTLRLIIPIFSGKSSKLIYPFSDEHSCLSLQDASIDEGKSIRMMGVPEAEIDAILESEKANLRIAGFEEEDKRLRRRMLGRHDGPIKLPQGPYIFADFRTLHIPGLELNPPASEALKRMHRLAADPGIIAIMNKHRWRVGIMTELAPVGYVGVSPKCILGFNKNHGEEISLRLRTDDLKGFRKYESIKKTLLHELAHMVYSEHDANFYALDKQLNEEAASLDWTRSQGRTLGRFRNTDVDDYEEEYHSGDEHKPPQKLGGNKLFQMESARASSVAAAYQRMATASINSDDSGFNGIDTPINHEKLDFEPDPDESTDEKRHFEPDPDYSVTIKDETVEGNLDELESAMEIVEKDQFDPESNQHELSRSEPTQIGVTASEPTQIGVTASEPDPDDSLRHHEVESEMHIEEPYPTDQELALIQDPVTAFCNRMQKAIKILQQEVFDPMEATKVLEMLVKIIGNAIQRPNELKFKRLRKGNPIIQRTIANHKAAMEILSLVGFSEDVIGDEMGKIETYLVLKRNDPGLLWLAKSSIEAVISC